MTSLAPLPYISPKSLSIEREFSHFKSFSICFASDGANCNDLFFSQIMRNYIQIQGSTFTDTFSYSKCSSCVITDCFIHLGMFENHFTAPGLYGITFLDYFMFFSRIGLKAEPVSCSFFKGLDGGKLWFKRDRAKLIQVLSSKLRRAWNCKGFEKYVEWRCISNSEANIGEDKRLWLAPYRAANGGSFLNTALALSFSKKRSVTKFQKLVTCIWTFIMLKQFL